MKVGLLGCGNIGSMIAKALINGDCPGKELSAICDVEKTENIEIILKNSGAVYVNDPKLLLNKGLDLIVEAANPTIASKHVLEFTNAGLNMLLLSSGALLEGNLYDSLRQSCLKTRAKVIVPSGAIGGLSVIKAAKLAGNLHKVILKTTKHPRSLIGAPFFDNSDINLVNLVKKTLIFEGPAEEAIKEFPKNVNVAVTLSLAGIGPFNTKIKVFADPNVSVTIHELEVEGDFGRMTLKLENAVSPENPRSSYLASLSAISALKDFDNYTIIGF